MGQRCLRQSFSCMYAHMYVKVACAPHPHPCEMQYCTCVWRAVYMCVVACMYICVCIAIVHIPTVLIFAICYIQSFMVACKTAKGSQVT